MLSQKRRRVTRSISAENPTGAKNAGGKAVDGPGKQCAKRLGPGWKISPCIKIAGKQTAVIADIRGSGIIKSIWMTHSHIARFLILRMYWEGEEIPAVEVPLGDFFANAWGTYYQNSSMMIQVNPGYGLCSYFEMPFHRRCTISIENLQDAEVTFFYQINYELGELGDDCCYFHAYYHRSHPLDYKKTHILLPVIRGSGHYVGASMFWQVNSNQWWGEGEIKFYIDGDVYPTICGTGTEDYFLGAWNFENPATKSYENYTSPYAGMHVFVPDGTYQANTRFQLYRWHVMDPICFEKDLWIEIQALGWRSGFQEYLPLQDDISSVVYWYQEEAGGCLRLQDDMERLEIV